MPRNTLGRLAALVLVFFGVWLAIRFALPLALPFLLGALVALGAEPLVALSIRRLKLPRPAAAGIGVAATLVLLGTVVVLLCSVLVRQLGTLAKTVPQLADSALGALTTLEDTLLQLTAGMPETVRPTVNQGILNLFDSGSAIMENITGRLPGMAGSVLSHVGSGALTVGTGVLSAFMISSRLPRIKAFCKSKLPESLRRRYLPALKRLRQLLGGWLRAQLKLGSISFLILTVGFLLLRIPYAPLWGLLVALVDALPMLGTGLVLLPWALVSLLQGNSLRSAGLLGIYAAAALTRSALEPRLLGKQLGLDPLMTLVALYIGYRLWGFPGMLLAPMVAMVAAEVSGALKKET